MNTDTPKTDAAIVNVDVAYVSLDGLSSSPQEYVEVDFARELERENAKLRKDLKDTEDALESVMKQTL